MNETHDPKVTGVTPTAPVDSLSTGPSRGSLSTGGSCPAAAPLPDSLPDVPGYCVLHEIARGGMGRVLAAHDLVLDRDVALKVLLPGANTERFVRESKITARLPHPGIPPVHALGTLADGSPFLAMKLIAGQTLSEQRKTADRPRLLQTFAQVCQAVGFAHSRGIIHRDLKPSNIMVGDFGEVQVMDWGLAKDLIGPGLPAGPRPEASPEPEVKANSGQTVDYLSPVESTDEQTRAGEVMGTPAYMAPEQARGEPVDNRADVFALGGILCTIITGKPPFIGASSVELIQQAATADLTDAHARLDQCAADAEVIALCRRCLSPNPADRPPNGQAVADELTTYLNSVQERLRAAEVARAAETARAEEANERVRVEHRARRVLVAASGLVLLVLLGGIAGTGVGMFRAKRAEGETKKRADELQLVSDYQAKMLQQVDAAEAGINLMADLRTRHRGALAKDNMTEAERLARAEAFERELHTVNATDAAVALLDRTVLAPAVNTIEAQFADQPVVDASLRMTLGIVYGSLARFDEALALYQRAHGLRATALGAEHPDTLTALRHIVDTLAAMNRPDEAESSIHRMVDSYRRTLGDDHPDSLNALHLKASHLASRGKLAESETCFRDVVQRQCRVLGTEHPNTLATMAEFGRYLGRQGKHDEAVQVLRTVLEAARRMPDQGQLISETLDNLGTALWEQGKFTEAEPYTREALEWFRRVRGEDHLLTLGCLINLSVQLQNQGRPADAEPLAREVVDKSRRIFGNQHRTTLASLNVLGRGYVMQGKPTQAEPYWREAYETGRRVFGEDHPDAVVWLKNLAVLLVEQQKFAEAEPLAREAVAKFRKAHGNDHLNTVVALYGLGSALQELGKQTEAEACFREGLENNRRKLGEVNPNTVDGIIRLGSLLAIHGNAAEAVAMLAPAEANARKAFPAVHQHRVARLLESLGKARIVLAKSSGDFAIAEANLLEAYTLYIKTRGPKSLQAHACTKTIADAYAAWDKADPGKGYDAKAGEWKSRASVTSK